MSRRETNVSMYGGEIVGVEESVLAAIRAWSGMSDEQIKEASEHGADTGWPGFTYTRDLRDFYRENLDTLSDLIEQDAEEYGFPNGVSFVASFGCAAQGYETAVAWYALERAGRYLSDRDEERG